MLYILNHTYIQILPSTLSTYPPLYIPSRPHPVIHIYMLTATYLLLLVLVPLQHCQLLPARQPVTSTYERRVMKR